jgi:hypothetical protein
MIDGVANGQNFQVILITNSDQGLKCSSSYRVYGNEKLYYSISSLAALHCKHLCMAYVQSNTTHKQLLPRFQTEDRLKRKHSKTSLTFKTI